MERRSTVRSAAARIARGFSLGVWGGLRRSPRLLLRSRHGCARTPHFPGPRCSGARVRSAIRVARAHSTSSFAGFASRSPATRPTAFSTRFPSEGRTLGHGPRRRVLSGEARDASSCLVRARTDLLVQLLEGVSGERRRLAERDDLALVSLHLCDGPRAARGDRGG